MKRKSIIASAALAAVLGCMAALPVQAGEKKQADMITCEDFLKMAPASQERIAYWVDGYQEGNGKAAIEVIEFDKFGQPVGEIVEDCKTTPKETLWQKLKKRL
ncbi:MAG: HdeA/HdeB family chaperone [Candidatus Binatia bacterium]